MNGRRGLLLAAVALPVLAAVACGKGNPAGRPTGTIRLATTTSARDTGLLDLLLPAFRAESGIEVQPLVVGTGEALKHGERSDADVLLVHSREAEDAFVAKGHGLERKDVAWNWLLLVGPKPLDPRPELEFWVLTLGTNMARAHPVIGHEGPGSNLLEADGIRTHTVPSRRIQSFLEVLAARSWTFVSRGDGSATHERELELWGLDRPKWPGYLETGKGMGATLTIADEKGAYTLTDESTYLRMRSALHLEPVLTEDPALRSVYGAILVKPQGRASPRTTAARRFYDWLTSESCRAAVRGLMIDGHRTFFLPEETANAAVRGRLDGEQPPR